MSVYANIGQVLIVQHIIDYRTVLFMHLNNIQISDNLSDGDMISFFDFKLLHQNLFFIVSNSRS